MTSDNTRSQYQKNGFSFSSRTKKMKYLVFILFIVPAHVLADITCPDGAKCEDGETCCSMEEGGYGCCPFPDAECCSDDQCCPSSTICVAVFHTCAGIAPDSNGTELFFSPSRPKRRPSAAAMPKTIPCPGAMGSCPDNTTCCPTGCCLEPRAVCCSDGKHCCPAGFICDIKRQKCVFNGVSKKRIYKKKMIEVQIPPQAMSLNAAFSVSAELRNVICPGGERYCPDRNTCCLSNTGDWKCCPLFQASCCEDGKHCCPKGTICSEGGKSCSVNTDWKRRNSLSSPFW